MQDSSLGSGRRLKGKENAPCFGLWDISGRGEETSLAGLSLLEWDCACLFSGAATASGTFLCLMWQREDIPSLDQGIAVLLAACRLEK